MKKILFFSCLILLIPIIVVTIFIREDEIEFHYTDNMKIRVKRSNGEIQNIDFENYIVGVIAGEMPVSFEVEALKAQAVASRSYAMVYMARNKDKEYDVVDSVNNQVYLDYDYLKNKWGYNYIENINKIKDVVNKTHGEYLDYNGEVVEALFFSTSVGKTENSEEVFSTKKDYLRSVSSTWDKVSPVFNESNTFKLHDFYSMLGLPYNKVINYRVTQKTSTGRILEIDINGDLINGHDFANKLGIRSNYFSIDQDNDTVYINTKGYGHGVGLSQYGAQGMALEGYTYDKILKHYYQGVKIKKI